MVIGAIWLFLEVEGPCAVPERALLLGSLYKPLVLNPQIIGSLLRVQTKPEFSSSSSYIPDAVFVELASVPSPQSPLAGLEPQELHVAGSGDLEIQLITIFINFDYKAC